jgi:hypothetical protein
MVISSEFVRCEAVLISLNIFRAIEAVSFFLLALLLAENAYRLLHEWRVDR